jgi:peptidoglycan/xylan/chitin deacetylase (PgdA/CDA1 family)
MSQKIMNRLIFFILLLLGVVRLIGFVHFQVHTVVDSKKVDMKSVPKNIHKEPDSASPSAVLRVPILMYHYVENVKDKRDTIRQSLNIPPYVFEQQVKMLKEDGYTFMTMSDLADVMDNRHLLPPKPIIFTFDDGHWDLFTEVLPILKKYDIRVTAYIISGFIGGSDFLSKNQLSEIIKSGNVEIGAHTVHHISLAKKLLPLVQYEVATSKKQLEDAYHISVVSFAYPSGSFDNQAMDVVKKAGFATAVSTVPGIEQHQSNRYYLYRLRPGARTGKILLSYLQQTVFHPW